MTGDLPRRPRVVVRVDLGDGPQHPTAVYTAPADVIARLLPALKAWRPDWRLRVEPVGPHGEDQGHAGGPPPLPTWRLWAWPE